MKQRLVAGLAVVALAAGVSPLAAQQSEEVTVTGRVVDANCFVTLAKSGDTHRQCATACARAGLPLAILTEDGTLYLPVSSRPADAQNPRLASFIERPVRVTGTHRLRAGMHTIEIKTVAGSAN